MVFRTDQTCLSLWESCRAATERAGSLFEGAGFAAGKPERVLQIDKIRMRFALIRTCQCAALSVICCANASSPEGRAEKPERIFLLFRTNQTSLSLWESCRAATERAGSLFEGAGLPPCGKTEGVLQIGKMRMRFALMQTRQRAAPSVTACAVPPSSGRKAFVSHNPNLSLPLGEMSRSDREGRLCHTKKEPSAFLRKVLFACRG